MPAIIRNSNAAPQNSLHFKAKFTTSNLDDGTLFQEPFIANGPTGSFNNPLNSVLYGGNKVFIPLTTNTSEGANYLKIWLPQTTSDILYVTFSKKADSMQDGYYDYITGVPDDYRIDFFEWIKDGSTDAITSTVTLRKNLFFTAYGKNTNQTSQAIQIKVEFSAIFLSKNSVSSQLTTPLRTL